MNKLHIFNIFTSSDHKREQHKHHVTRQYLATDDTKQIHFFSEDQEQGKQMTARVCWQQDIKFHRRCPIGKKKAMLNIHRLYLLQIEMPLFLFFFSAFKVGVMGDTAGIAV